MSYIAGMFLMNMEEEVRVGLSWGGSGHLFDWAGGGGTYLKGVLIYSFPNRGLT